MPCRFSMQTKHLLLLQVHAGGLWEPWCEFSASLDPTKPSEPVSISPGDTAAAVGNGSSGSSSSSAGVTIHGHRYRLTAMQEVDTRALPTKGKVGSF